MAIQGSQGFVFSLEYALSEEKFQNLTYIQIETFEPYIVDI